MTGVTMRAESSILGLVEIVTGVAIAATPDASYYSHLGSVMTPRCVLQGIREPGSYDL